MLRKLLLLIVVVPLLILTAVFVIRAFWPDGEEVSAQEKKTLMGSVSVPLPEGWQVRSEPGVAYAVKAPCASLACAGLAVFEGNGLTGNWQKTIPGRYMCTRNKKETAGSLTQKGTPTFGEQGTIQYTVPLCGVSNSEMLEIWETRLPTRIIVAPIDPTRRMPEVVKRLGRAQWG